MATYYLDFVNGNDANTGADWANAWKTLNNGATAARIAPGDEIRIAKSADPTSIGNATWTNLSTTVTLASAQTTSIYLDGAWTLANSATSTTTTTRKEGNNAAQITTPASTATSTKYAYYTIGGGSGVNLSSYDAITLWFRNNTTSIADANRYVIKLCSDTTGDTAVDEFAIPDIASTSAWIPLTLTRNGGGNLGNSIQSIAWYSGSSTPGNSNQVFIDDVLACTNTGLNLTSLISKNSAAFGGTETWHGLQSIAGTTVILGNTNGLSANVGLDLRGYYTKGTSPETVTTYVRPTIKWTASSTAGGYSQPLTDSGTAGNFITYSGGWNTSSNTQDGVTWIDGQNGLGYGIGGNGNSRNYLKFTRLYLCRFNYGIGNGSTSLTGWQIDDLMVINSSNALETSYTLSTLGDIILNNNNSPLSVQAVGLNNYYTKLICYSGQPGLNNMNSRSNFGTLEAANMVQFNLNNNIIDTLYVDNISGVVVTFNSGNLGKTIIKDATVKNLSGPGNLGSNILINKLTASGNGLGYSPAGLTVKQFNGATNQLLGTATGIENQQPCVFYGAVNNNVNDNRAFWRFGNALSQTTTRHTASGVAWQINITDTYQNSVNPALYPVAQIAVNANKQVTVKAWVKLSHATDIGAKLAILNGEIAGVSSDVTATKTADTNWEELSINFTPTVSGAVQIYVLAYWLANTADESVYVDDMTITQA